MTDVVFIIAINRDERSLTQKYDYSIKSWAQWCRKNGKELFILREDITDPNYIRPNWYKYFALDLLDQSGVEYDQVCYVDADTVIHPDTPDFFKETERKFCAVENYGSLDWVLRSIEIYGDQAFEGLRVPYYEYFNSGFMVFNKDHRPFLDTIKDFLVENRDNLVRINSEYGIGHDQTPVNLLRVRENVDFKLMSYKYNFQDLMRREAIDGTFTFTKFGYIYHFNCGVKPSPGFWIENTYKHFYGDQ